MESLCGRGGAEILVCFSVFLKQPLGCFFQSDRSCTRTLFLFFFVENDIIETDERNEKGGIPLANKETIQEIVLVIIGNLVLALGVTVFILPNDVLTGGLTGIAVALEPVIHVEPTLVINVMTVALFFVGWLFLGRRFALKTLVSTICYPLFLSLLAWVVDTQFPENYFIMDRYLATIYGGILMGCGVGLIFRCGASSGGMDIPPLVLHKFTHIPLATLVLITDTLTVLLGVATYGFQAALVGIISVFLSSVAIDKMLTLGAIKSKNCMIISQRYEEMLSYIHQELYRGTTILQGHGGFTQENRPVIMVVVSKKQYPLLEHEVLKVDPNAFIIVTDTDEVHGLGFTYEEEDF